MKFFLKFEPCVPSAACQTFQSLSLAVILSCDWSKIYRFLYFRTPLWNLESYIGSFNILSNLQPHTPLPQAFTAALWQDGRPGNSLGFVSTSSGGALTNKLSREVWALVLLWSCGTCWRDNAIRPNTRSDGTAHTFDDLESDSSSR